MMEPLAPLRFLLLHCKDALLNMFSPAASNETCNDFEVFGFVFVFKNVYFKESMHFSKGKNDLVVS